MKGRLNLEPAIQPNYNDEITSYIFGLTDIHGIYDLRGLLFLLLSIQ